MSDSESRSHSPAAGAPSVKIGVALSLLCLLLLGVMPIIVSSRPAEMTALSFAIALSLWQTAFAAPVYALERRRRPSRARVPQAMRRRIALIALLTGALFGLSTYLYVVAVGTVGPANAAIALQAYPLFAILWESVFLGRRKSALELSLTLILLGALYYLGTGGTFRLSGLSASFLLALAVPLLWSVAHVLIKVELSETPITPVEVTFFRVTLSSLFLLAVMAATAPAALAALPSAVLHPIAALMGLVYYLELVVWFYAVRHIDVSLASSITTPWPALTMALAALLLGETIEPYQIAALVIVVLCIYGLTLASLRKAASA
ncbi:MAG: DMT family transporter [Pseudomonadota bacterium]